LFWAGIPRHQWPPGSPSLLVHISLWRAAERLSPVGICPLSIPSLLPPLSRASCAGLSFGCSGRRDVPASGPSCFCRHTTSICHRLSVRTVLGMRPMAQVWTPAGRIWLPEASCYSFGWVSCFQLCLSACNPDGSCSCRPPTQPQSPPSLLLRFVYACSPPRCTLVLSLCLSCDPLPLDLLGGLRPHFRECQCVPQPSGSRFQYRLHEEFSHSG